MRIDWDKVWNNFEKWMVKREENGLCFDCGHMTDFPDWEEQQKRIQQIVNRQLRRKK